MLDCKRWRGAQLPESTAGTEAASRVIDVLLLFAEESPLGVTGIARSLGVSKSVVHRILQTLVVKGMLVADPGSRGYRLGPAASMLGARALHDCDLRAAAIDVIHELRDVTGETATLTTMVPQGRIYLDQVESGQEIKMTVELGRRFPLHAGSSGKCMLAFLPEQGREQVLRAGLSPVTAQTIIDPDTLREELARIRHCGYATSEGERQRDAASVAAPVSGHGGIVLGALSVCGPRYRLTVDLLEEIAPRVVAAARTVSRRMGAPDRELEEAR